MTRFYRLTGLVTVFALSLGILCLCAPFASAQAKKGAEPPPQKVEIPPDSDYMFRKDAATLDDIKAKETDPQKRADALLAWVKDHPKSTRAIAYAAAFYGEVVLGVIKSGDAQKGLAMIQTFQTAAPADASLVSLQMTAYYQAKNYAKAAEIGEKLYAEKPNAEMEATLYQLYVAIPNTDKALVYGEKLVAANPIEKSYSVALYLAQVYYQKKNTEKALHYFSEVMNVYGDKVPTGVQEAAWNTTRAGAFSMMAADAYTKKDFAKAMELYDKVTKYAPSADEVACQAWYYIGMAKWQNKDQKAAMEPFARAYVIGKSLSPKAKDNLDNLWKAEHNNSLDGEDAVIAKAKSDLGIK
jgi:tetratricopeptide (TPR) repeat protein